MSRLVEVTELRYRDLFALPNGTIYQASGSGTGALQARVWCAHPPDSITSDSPPINLAPGQSVQLLSRDETRGHTGHAGYVRAVFADEMDRRHQERMQVVMARRQREAAALHQLERARWPWWKKLFRSGARSRTRLDHPAP